MPLTLEEKEKQTIKVMGADIPRWQDCQWCGTKLACSFAGFAYSQPCDNCKNTERYEKERNKPKLKDLSMKDALSSNKVASVWEGGGRTYYVNNKGNVIKDEPSRPLAVGKKDWK